MKRTPSPKRVGAAPPPKRPTKPRRARVVASDRPPPESSLLRDRVAHGTERDADEAVSADALAERMGEDAVMAITTGEDETDAERGDGDAHESLERATRDDSLFDAIPGDSDDEEDERADDVDDDEA